MYISTIIMPMLIAVPLHCIIRFDARWDAGHLKESPDPCNSTTEGSPTVSDDLFPQENQFCHTLFHIRAHFTYVYSKQINTVCWICQKEINLRNSSVESHTIKHWNSRFTYSNCCILSCHIHYKHDK